MVSHNNTDLSLLYKGVGHSMSAQCDVLASKGIIFVPQSPWKGLHRIAGLPPARDSWLLLLSAVVKVKIKVNIVNDTERFAEDISQLAPLVCVAHSRTDARKSWSLLPKIGGVHATGLKSTVVCQGSGSVGGIRLHCNDLGWR